LHDPITTISTIIAITIITNITKKERRGMNGLRREGRDGRAAGGGSARVFPGTMKSSNATPWNYWKAVGRAAWITASGHNNR
jgi:hypothetical protein